MKPTTEFTQRYNKVLSDILARAEPEWLHDRRSEAYALFQKLGLPTTRDEDWKYTSLASLERAALATWSPEAPVPAGLPTDSFEWAYAHRMVFVDGRFNPGLSILREPEPGVTLVPLSQAVNFNRPAVREFMGRLDSEGEALAAFNTALWRNGLYLELDRGVQLSRPLIVHCLSSGGRLVPLHHLIVLGEGAQASVIEHYQSTQAGVHFTNTVTECLLGAQAKLTHIKLQDEHDQAFHTARIVARQGAGSRWLSLSLAAGGSLTRNDIISHLEGEGASCTLNGLAIGAGRRHVDHHTYINHSLPGCTLSAENQRARKNRQNPHRNTVSGFDLFRLQEIEAAPLVNGNGYHPAQNKKPHDAVAQHAEVAIQRANQVPEHALRAKLPGQ